MSKKRKTAWYIDLWNCLVDVLHFPFYHIIYASRHYSLTYNKDRERGYLQTFYKPARYFTVAMESGRLGIMRRTSCESFHDFGCSCYSVSFRSTGVIVGDETRGRKK